MMNTVVFNKANLAKWKKEATEFQAKVQGIIPLINQEQFHINSLNIQLGPVQSQINNLQIQLNQISQDRYMRDHYYHPHHHHYDYHHHHHHHHDYTHLVWDLAGDYTDGIRRAPIQAQLNGLVAQKNSILSALEIRNNNYKQYQGDLSGYQSQLGYLQKNIQSGEKFLDELKNNPNTLITQLKARISTQFSQYEKQHPVNLPPEVRLCLLNLTQKLDAFSTSDDLKTAQLNYLNLSAFIYEMQDQIAAVAAPTFQKVLSSLVEETHLIQDLPDELETKKPLRDHFSSLKSQHAELFNTTIEQLIQQEEATYIELQKTFPLTHDKGGNLGLTNAINTAYRTMNKEIAFKQSKNELVDFHFYNRTSKLLVHLNKNPLDQAAIQDLAHIVKFASGKPTGMEKFLGGLSIVLGVLLVITGFVLMGLACANCPPLALGLSVAAQGLLGAACALVGTTSGLTAGFLGNKLFKGQDLFKDLSSVNKELKDSPKPTSM